MLLKVSPKLRPTTDELLSNAMVLKNYNNPGVLSNEENS
jgi:hypothetical protein